MGKLVITALLQQSIHDIWNNTLIERRVTGLDSSFSHSLLQTVLTLIAHIC